MGRESSVSRKISPRTEPIRLVQAVHDLGMGGSEVLAWSIARSLNKSARYSCSIYAVDHGGLLAKALSAESIPFKIFSRTRRMDFRLIGQLASHLRADKVQLVHTHHLCQLLYAGIAGRLAGARVIHTEHDCHSISRRRSQRLFRFLSVVADFVTGVSEEVTAFLRERIRIPTGKLKTIPNGVDLVRFQSAHPANRSLFGWNEEDVIIGCVARLALVKGHRVLLEAFRRVRSRVPHVRLLLIGDGNERGGLLSMVEELDLSTSVLFLGMRDDIPELLGTCDLVASASIKEGLPISILEAMAAGKPVVATQVGGVAEVVKDNQTGLLVPAGNAELLAHALEVLALDPSRRRRLGAQAYEFVRDHHDFGRTVENYESLYATCLR